MKQRFLDYLIAFIIILCLNFALPRLMPGDPISSIYGEEAMLQMSPEMEAKLTERLGLDKPIGQQFTDYIVRLAHGDMGYSLYHKAPVTSIIASYLPWTLLLAGSAFLLATVLGIVLGIESAWRRGRRIDRCLLISLMSMSGLPSFFVGAVLLLIFGVYLQCMPLQNAYTSYADLTGLALVWDVAQHLALPLTSLVIVFLPNIYLLMRNSTLAVVREPYVLTAHAKGLRPGGIRYHHVARNALLPVVTAVGMMIASRLVTGALFVEVVFSYPGMGLLIRQALTNRDYPVLQGALLMTTLLVLGINLLVDFSYAKIDPRINHAH
ncbi:MAG: ABC transporter permease [Planctomycetota bacterium]